MKKLYKISAGSLLVELTRQDAGLALTRVYDRKKRICFFNGISSLLTVTARRIDSDEKIYADTLSGWGRVTAEENGDETVIILSDNQTLAELTVTIHAAVSDDRISWNVSLISSSKDFSLYSCDYPRLPFNCSVTRKFLSPYGCGEVWDSMREQLISTQNYPSYGVSMQMFAMWDTAARRGLYYGVHDGAPAYKTFTFSKPKGADAVTLYSTMPMCDIARAGNSQQLYGTLVWEIFDGDWYDASMIYRDWVLTGGSWIPSNVNGVRTDLPDWFRLNGHWWRVRIANDDSYADELIKCNKLLGYDSPVHMYDWHQIPYDNDYPHYFPVKDNMVSGLKKLKDANVRVMPYINGRLWDTRDRGIEDWQFSTKGLPNCTKNRSGEPFIETYNSVESDGSKVRLSIMCPSSAVWQEKVQENVSKLLNDYGVNAVYVDQVAAASPYLCEDPTHSHRAGGGSWWCESYTNLLDHVRLVKPDETFISTECTAEPFMKHIQAYLTWMWVKNDQVPAFAAIYCGLVAMFGRNYGFLASDDDQGQRMYISESLVFGEQLGWIVPENYEGLQHREFYNKCVDYRTKNATYFAEGRLLRPPVVTDNAPKLYTDRAKEAYGGIITHSPVYAGHWRRNADGAEILLLVNAADEPVKCKVECSLPDGVYKLGKRNVSVRRGVFRCTLPACSISDIRI